MFCSKENVIGKRQIYRRAQVEVQNLLSSTNNSNDTLTYEQASTSFSNNDTLLQKRSFTTCLNNDILDNLNLEYLQSSSESENTSIQDDFYNHSNLIIPDHNVALPQNSFMTSTELKKQLVQWAIGHNITQTAFTSLLHILSPSHPELPMDCRSLLKTPTNQIIKLLETGEYTHFGILENLFRNLSLCPVVADIFPDNKVKLSFNIDGIPLFHSNNIQFWPILGRIVNSIKFQPFVVGIFCGNSKPQPLNQYLEDFIKEMLVLLKEGFFWKEKLYSVEIHSFICDAPARSFIKCVKSHGGYSSCDKCVEEGKYFNKRVILQGTSAPRRTDDSFLSQDDEEHHLGVTPLVDLQIGLVSCFPIDYMHAVCLGVMKKLLNVWVRGPLVNRLSSQEVRTMSEHLLSFRKYIPFEINRKPRELSDLARWKATEFRTFLLYTGPIILKEIVDIAVYEHFLLLHCGILILTSKNHLKKLGSEFAKNLLTNFIAHSSKIYGEEFLVYNVHVLCHLSDDAEHFGPLDNFSAFVFESYLGQLKKLIRASNKPLQQIYRRLNEINKSTTDVISFQNKTECFILQNAGPYNPMYKQFKKLVFQSCTYCTCNYSIGNSYCKVGDVIVQIHNILENSDTGEIMITGKRFRNYKSFYSYPVNSTIFGIYIVENLMEENEMWSVNDIIGKCIIFPAARNIFVCFPLIHSF